LSQKMATTNASGQASVRLTSASMGDITVTAKVSDNAVDKGKSATVSFTADIATSTVTNIQPPKGSSTTANFRLIPITATVEDRGHLVPNVDVRFTTTLGNISPKIATTKANGQTTVNLSGGTPGNAIVTAKVDSNANDTGKSTTVTFIPDIDRPIPKPE
ncbi:Ig-like domain-containing protein, partial [Pectobacterium brasiliense]|uniref:Ig-like domain-containing protein n=1 Tax=Pectobacterium brasiliense TaxID=180957 RepID=UPI001F458160